MTTVLTRAEVDRSHDTPIEGNCNAKKRQGPGLCRRPAGWKTDHPGIGACGLHGGAMRDHRIAASRIRIEEGARTVLADQGFDAVEDPLRALQELAGEVLKFKDVIREKVEQLGSWVHYDQIDHEEVRGLIGAYERALDRSERTLTSIVRLNIEERLARVTQAQAAIMIRIVEAVLDSREMDLPGDKRLLGRSIVAREVEAVVASPPAVNGAPAPA
jgi:hypothetical protein